MGFGLNVGNSAYNLLIVRVHKTRRCRGSYRLVDLLVVNDQANTKE